MEGDYGNNSHTKAYQGVFVVQAKLGANYYG